MYLLTMFDLPSKTKRERRVYRCYRTALLELGFAKIQFSVYIKHVENAGQADTLKRSIRKALPKRGDVRTINLTDAQYQSMETFCNSKELKNAPPLEDLVVF